MRVTYQVYQSGELVYSGESLISMAANIAALPPDPKIRIDRTTAFTGAAEMTETLEDRPK